MLETRLILITLLINLGVAAAVSAGLARSRDFKRLLFLERRTPAQTLGLLAFIVRTADTRRLGARGGAQLLRC